MFFFQAEDGIRDLVRSRGLGDVYKRQVRIAIAQHGDELVIAIANPTTGHLQHAAGNQIAAVSYTHLTLPTSDLV